MPEHAISNDITIAPATQEDVPIILSLVKELAEYERLSHTVTATEELLFCALFGEKPVAEAVVASDGGKPVGFALFFHNFSTFVGKPGIYLEDVYVKPEARGKGVGKALLRHVARIARERDCGRFEWTVLEWNKPAIAFYQQQGASVLEDWRVCRVTGEALTRLAEGTSR